jgi:hypothetical protein
VATKKSALQQTVAKLVQDAKGTKTDVRFLSNFLTRPLYPVPYNIYDQFLPITEYEELRPERTLFCRDA